MLPSTTWRTPPDHTTAAAIPVPTTKVADTAAIYDAVWEAGAVAVGWGSTDGHDAAKRAARAGDPGAAQALLATARQRGLKLAPER